MLDNLIVQPSKQYYPLENVGIIFHQNIHQNRPFPPFTQKLSSRLDGVSQQDLMDKTDESVCITSNYFTQDW